MTEYKLQKTEGWELFLINELQGYKVYINLDENKKARVKQGVVIEVREIL